VLYPTDSAEQREAALAAAANALRSGQVVVIPTDTVYGVAADAFKPEAVRALLAAKGRGPSMPPPVLVGTAATVDALAVQIPDWARALIQTFWPGPLTIVFHEQPSLMWDLGETKGTVAVRMPDDSIALDLIASVGPIAVSSANTTGLPAATNAADAERMLGDLVTLDAGDSPVGEASTIVDATSGTPRILRLGAISLAQLDEVLEPFGHRLGAAE
jgi:tRNA threonylcarbamoyl adenosine modification protein (Sua5/YciO/YrdC/YwlC family)